MKYILATIFGLLFFTQVRAGVNDSLRVQTIDGKRYIIHKIEKGEGLLAISRRYKVDMQLIISTNSIDPKKIKKGDIIKIPITSIDTLSSVYEKAPVDDTHANADADDKVVTAKRHIVAQGETLNKIAQRYKVTVQDIVKWNAIRNNKIEVGQALIVDPQSALKPYEALNSPATGTEIQSVKAKNGNIAVSMVEQTGFAKLNEDNMLVCDDKIPDNTLVRITNLDNGKECLVKVKHINQPIDTQPGIILYINSSVALKLDVRNNRIGRVSVKYIAD